MVFVLACGLGSLGLSSTALAQYPGRISTTDKNVPVLRSLAVLEWIGQPGKPSASRLVPISVFDGEQLNDGTLYLDRPQPLALDSGVEYVLQQGGRPTALYDVFGAGEVSGTWQGVGVWKSLSANAETKSRNAFNESSLYHPKVDDEGDDKPVLHRKHPTDAGSSSDSGSSSPAGTSSGSGSGTSSSSQSDPDRPALHRKSSGDSSTASSSGSSDGSGSGSGSREDVDPDRPTLHRQSHAEDSDTAGVSTLPPDPDRPRLMHGKPADLETPELPRLVGTPPSMQQLVAVSDASSRPVHPWSYSWSDPADEAHYKQQLEALARTALGLDKPPAPVKTAKASTAKTTKKKTSLLATATNEPAPLADEQFHVYELAYNASATMVLTASTPKPQPANAQQPPQTEQTASDDAPKIVRRSAPGAKSATVNSQVKDDTSVPENSLPAKSAPQKFVTLIAQPDLYGGVLVLYKSVTDSAHLDVTPRMRLVDAVDATADNRAELLFELRGDGQRQFALYRILRGSAEQMFATVAMP